MKRAGFTMIELIFVIVILGILAAVAVPKLAATRDDAKISAASADIATFVTDVGSYYTSKGEFGKIQEMTNVNVIEAGTTDLVAGGTITYEVATAAGVCFTFTATADGNLTVAHTGTDTGIVCTTLGTVKADLIKTHSFGGTGVVY